ncbi:hypothetical protein [Shimia thalassica]|uniref:hypothetical protein n=1 Tax=Shimia thalassica TaxID=1715693 RepID=UPI002736ABDB|nr:hypothetical protein [Shimia thalassica]MDP2520540.1 hypothetical protein [Shimia thalassica]
MAEYCSAVHIARQELERFGSVETIGFDQTEDLVDAFLAKQIEMIVANRGIVSEQFQLRGMDDPTIEIPVDFLTIERSIALRFGLGQIREALNAEIPAYLLSDEYRALQQEYFGEPVFWTEGRQRMALMGSSGAECRKPR